MITIFKNGNMNCKIDRDSYDKRESDIVNLLWELQSNDCTLLGEEFCLSNYDMGVCIYSYFTDKKYIISYSDVKNIWLAGKILKLYALDMTEDDKEELENQD